MKAKESAFAEILRIAFEIITAPADSFKSMPKTGGFLEPVAFAAVMGLVASIISSIWNFLGIGYYGGVSPGFLAILLSIVYMPLVFVLSSFIIAAVVFLVWKKLGSRKNYETAYRSVAYLMAILPVMTVLWAIPYAGKILIFATATYYIFIVSTEIHNIIARKALKVFGIIALVILLPLLYYELDMRNKYATTEQVRKAAEETAQQYQQHLDDVRARAEGAKK